MSNSTSDPVAPPEPDDATVVSGRPPLEPAPPSNVNSAYELGGLLQGEVLNHFDLQEYIGGGGMGAVFRAEDTMLGRQVAVKVLSSRYGGDEETVRRFRNEAQSAARLDHENIARVYYVGEDQGWHYLVLEYIEGENLRDMVNQSGPLPVEQVVSYTLQIAAALAHAGDRDVVHRDIKPSNVLITTDGRVKLVDMGLARLHQVEHSQDDLTASGVTLGTFDYISPEQARDPRVADVRSDLYSLGCTVFYMLTGRPPFPEGTVLQKLLQHQGEHPPDPRQFRRDVPEEFYDFLNKLLAKNPQERYQHPRELVAELALLSQRWGLRAPASSPMVAWTAPRTSWLENHIPWIVPLVILLLVFAGLRFFRSTPKDFAPPPPTEAATMNGAQTPSPAEQFEEEDGPIESGGTTTSEKPADPSDLKQPSTKSLVAPQETPDETGAPSANGNEPANTPKRILTKTVIESPPEEVFGDPPSTIPSENEDSPANPPLEHEEDLVLVVGNSLPEKAESGAAQRRFDSLAAACREATPGTVIELRYNGRRKQERPILLSGQKLTIRAAEGYEPVITFRPDGTDLHPAGMITVSQGDLSLANIHLEMEVPRDFELKPWRLLEIVHADRVRLQRCTMTIRNAAKGPSYYAHGDSFFYIRSTPRRDLGMTMPDEKPSPEPRVHIELRNTVARGEATLLGGPALHAVSCRWQNGLLVTSEPVVRLEAATRNIGPGNPLELELEHITALARGGLVLMTSSGDQRRLPVVKVRCTDSILTTEGSPLIVQRGEHSVDEFYDLFDFVGKNCMYEGFTVFWRISGRGASEPVELAWSDWREHWGPGNESLNRPASVIWSRLPEELLAASRHTPDDFVLDLSGEGNPAVKGASDGVSDIGFQRDRLSQPPEPRPVESIAEPNAEKDGN